MKNDLTTLYNASKKTNDNTHYSYYLGCSPEAKDYLCGTDKGPKSRQLKIKEKDPEDQNKDIEKTISYQINNLTSEETSCSYLINVTFEEEQQKTSPSQ